MGNRSDGEDRGAPHGTAHIAVDRIAGVEAIETKLDATQARFVARSMANPVAVEELGPGDFEKSQEEMGEGRHWTDHEDSGWKAGTDGFETVADRMMLGGNEEISWGGTNRKAKVFTPKIGNKKINKRQWEERIKYITVEGEYDLAFTDGSKLERGETGAGWSAGNQFQGVKG